MTGTARTSERAAAEPVLLLTRPEPAARRFLDDLSAALGAGAGVPRAVLAPLMAIDAVAAPLPEGVAGLVLTSANALDHVPPGLPRGLPAWCVGDRTAAAARAAGFAAISAGGDAEALIRLILGQRPRGPLLHLRGEHARGEVAARLSAAGLPCAEAVVYRQHPLPLGPAARAVLAGGAPVVAPLFSPRTASLLAEEGPFQAPLHLVAISAAAAARAAGLKPRTLAVAAEPTPAAMLAATARALEALRSRATDA